jgi:hypothetical protein
VVEVQRNFIGVPFEPFELHFCMFPVIPLGDIKVMVGITLSP